MDLNLSNMVLDRPNKGAKILEIKVRSKKEEENNFLCEEEEFPYEVIRYPYEESILAILTINFKLLNYCITMFGANTSM